MTCITSALVIGGGVAGPATAIALAKAGIQATVYEARAESQQQQRGVMLTLATNGIDALRAIDADRRPLAAGFPTASITLRSHTGKRLGATSTGGVLGDGTVSHTIRRADLSAALRAEARERGIHVEHGRRLVELDEGADGVRVRFQDGSEAEADILVGADGVHSTVRRLIRPEAPAPTYTGLITTGGYARGVDVATPPGDYEMIFGKRAFFGSATAPDGEVWWFVNIPWRPEPARGEVEAIATDQWRHRLAELYADDAGPALELIAASPDFAPMSAIHTVPRLPRWSSRRAIVIGDAAHAPSPTSGQGASLAIEDAVVLAQALRDLDSPADAFTHVETVRRPRVEAIIRTAARINSNKAPGPVGRVLRDALLPGILRSAMAQKSAAQAYDHHLEWSSEQRATR